MCTRFGGFQELSENDLSYLLDEKQDEKKTNKKATKVAGLNVFREYLKEEKVEEGNFFIACYLFFN